MESLISNKVLLFGFIIVLVINTIYKPRLPTIIKKVLHNAVFNIALITYLTFGSNYTIEFSLIVAVTVLIILEMISEIENFEVTDNKTSDDVAVNNSTLTSKTPDSKKSDFNTSNSNTSDSNTSDSNTSNSNTSNSKMLDSKMLDSKMLNSTPVTSTSVTSVPVTSTPVVTSTSNNSSNLVSKPPSTPTALQSNGIVTSSATQASSPTASTSQLGLKNNNSSNNNSSNNNSSNNSDSDQTFVNRNSSTSDNSTTKCEPIMPKLSFTSKDDPEAIVKILTNTALLTSPDNCKQGKISESHLLLGNYKTIEPTKQDSFYLMPAAFISVLKKEEDVTKRISLIIKKGYKITMISKSGVKTFFGATTDEDGIYAVSDDIIKAITNISELTVEPIKK